MTTTEDDVMEVDNIGEDVTIIRWRGQVWHATASELKLINAYDELLDMYNELMEERNAMKQDLLDNDIQEEIKV